MFSFEGRRYAASQAGPGERVELVLGPRELVVYSTLEARRLARVLPDPCDSVSLAQVLSALTDPDVHRRPLSVYQEAARG